MSLELYIEQLNKTKKVSEVKCIIITELWGSGDFPGNWVSSSHLLNITNQKYFDRRTRELRDEHGVDLDQAVVNGEHSYRILSSKIGKTNVRGYLTASAKKELLRDQNNTCQVCGKKSTDGVRGLQADHKVPLTRGGQNSLDNWQVLCNECNVAKRRSCQGCDESCSKCHWAFPNSNFLPVTLRLPKSEFDYLDGKLKVDPNWLVDLIKRSN